MLDHHKCRRRKPLQRRPNNGEQLRDGIIRCVAWASGECSFQLGTACLKAKLEEVGRCTLSSGPAEDARAARPSPSLPGSFRWATEKVSTSFCPDRSEGLRSEKPRRPHLFLRYSVRSRSAGQPVTSLPEEGREADRGWGSGWGGGRAPTCLLGRRGLQPRWAEPVRSGRLSASAGKSSLVSFGL